MDGRSNGNILVLCYGNIYRSPFVAEKISAVLDPSRWTIRSAGFYHKSGRPCTDDYVILAREFGISLEHHRSRQVSADDLEWADLIVIMDRKNWDLLREFGGTALEKAVWIGTFLDSGLAEVPDPYNRSDADVKSIVGRLERAATALVERLQKD